MDWCGRFRSPTGGSGRTRSRPVEQADRPRDELAIKLALALTTPGVDVRTVVQTQRTATMRQLQELTRLKAADEDADLAWRLVLEAMVFQGEAEVRWLDHCEASLARFAGSEELRRW